MGNLSSTPSSSTTTTNGEQYDVFLSFRGVDTRDGFTSHLYYALDEKQIKTFRDDKLERGEAISEGLLSAIGESKISVIIFSENYTSSKWCLLELAEIMKYREKKKQIVIPVFYKVEPSDVRKSYKAAFAEHENEWKQFQKEKKIEWGPALTEASNLCGIVVTKGRNEAEFVCDIVSDVWNKLNNICPCDFKELVKGLVGIEKPIERVVSLLCLGVPDFRIIGIWGMGGMGKTTIADAVFQLVSHQFEKTHFALCVREESEKDRSRLFRLRDEIICKVLNEKDLKIDSLSIPQSIKRRLNQKKVLIVLDDVDKLAKFEILAGGLDRFGPGSRIILTTRDKQVLHNCGVVDHNMYKVEGLNDDEALQLFYNKAFNQNHPTKDFEVLSRDVVKIAKNLPLAVRVLGGSLLNKKSKRDWENAIDKFRRYVNPDVFAVLRISYDGLDVEEKGLFLDIACFVEFKFKINKEDFEPNLSSDREFSLIGLIDKSLVTVEYGHIKMHDLLRDMGREIVHKESPNEPGNRSRLWRQKDVLRALKHNDGTDAVQGIFLNMLESKDLRSISHAFEKMYNLKTLIITNVIYSNGDLDYLPDELRYLHWKWYPLEVLPSSFNPVNLVELALFRSNIKQLWERRTCVPKLKRLHLSQCENLIRIPDFSDIPSAESINLENCRSLLEIHSSTECPKLKRLNLNDCKNLIRIPDLLDIPSAEIINLECCISLREIHSSRECPKNLHSLRLLGCKNLSRFPSNIHIEDSEFSLRDCISLTKFPHVLGNIKRLELRQSGVEEVPSTIRSLSKLESLDMTDCRRLKRISKSICKLKSLDRLYLSGCCKLESFPDILEGMELKYLDLRETAIKMLPPSIENLNWLEELFLSLTDLPSILQVASLKLEKLPPLSGLCSLKKLRLINCNLTEISDDIGCLSSLEMLELHGNLFERLPKSIKKLSKLYHLTLSYCGMLRSLPGLPSSLRYLEAMNCKQLIQSFPDESEFELCAVGSGSLHFNFINCLKLNQKAVSNLFQDSLLKMQLMGIENIISLFEQDEEEAKAGICLPGSEIPPPSPFPFFIPPRELDGEVAVSICLPGSEIPEWFCYKNIGSSINIPVLRNDCGRSRYIMGFAVCLVIGFVVGADDVYFTKRGFDVRYDFHIETSDGHKEGFFDNSIPVICMSDQNIELIGLDHILLGYNLSCKCYEFFQKLDTQANRSMSDYVAISFEFNLRLEWCRVKYCGIQPIYVQAQVMNSVSINQYTGDTSGCNDTAEETCEPHPKRICIEANQCS